MTKPVENPVKQILLLHLIHWSLLWGECYLPQIKTPGDVLLIIFPRGKQAASSRRCGLLLLDGLTVLAGVQMNLANSLITTSNICRHRNRLALTPSEAISLSSACKEDIV